MKKLLTISLALMLAASTTYAVTITSINANNAITNYDYVTGKLTMTGTSGGSVQFDNTTNMSLGGSFTLSLYLTDASFGTTAAANLDTSKAATFSFYNGSTVYLAGTISSFNLIEAFDNGGMLAGQGAFSVDAGSTLLSAFGNTGNIVDITFFAPAALNNFNTMNFSSSPQTLSNFTITSVPEPATMGLLSLGAFGLLKRRNVKK
ncbi:MAG: PEP-CTERM sorting domain-containing protein [Planctomycetaceae bacterium]|nr:PEP-CTERM sorting domain-containing protein [Planctomycetaceae bacterium]